MLRAAAYASASSHERMFQLGSRHGAMTLRSGAYVMWVSSKRTWSFPLPVHPCASAKAPTLRATSIWRLAMIGRAIEVPRRYFRL